MRASGVARAVANCKTKALETTADGATEESHWLVVTTARTRLDAVQVQGAYYVAGGIWPILHLRSFMALTGPKQDTWLVKVFGAFIAAVGVVLLVPVARAERAFAARLAVISAVTLAGAEAWYVARRRISPIYLADAALELLFAAVIARRGR